jgi:hypothetical protein
MTDRDQYQRVHCWPCGGTGKLKGTRAKAGSRDAVGRQKLKTCRDCNGKGYTEERIRRAEAAAQ